MHEHGVCDAGGETIVRDAVYHTGSYLVAIVGHHAQVRYVGTGQAPTIWSALAPRLCEGRSECPGRMPRDGAPRVLCT